jgi:hypothetical protein
MAHSRLTSILLMILVFSTPMAVLAHGIAGDRYFPPTIAVDDPYAGNEIHAVVGQTSNTGAGNANTASGNVVGAGFGLEPLDGFGITFDSAWRNPNANFTPSKPGFDNLNVTIKKELTINDHHEFALSVGVATQAGGTGTSGTSASSNYAPTVYFAKGFGDLPAEMELLKPLAVTGVLGYQIPTDTNAPKIFNWGFTLQYSLLYLQNHVRDIGLAEPLNRMIAVVEFPMQTCLDSYCAGQVTGSVNPGVVWVGEHFNLSAEAVLPINKQSGSGVGFLLQIHKFLGKG